MAGGVMQNFQYGKISWNPATGSRITKGGIGVTWDNAGGPLTWVPHDGGILADGRRNHARLPVRQDLLELRNRVTHHQRRHRSDMGQGGRPASGLGYPTTDEYATANGGITQTFQYGQVVSRLRPVPASSRVASVPPGLLTAVRTAISGIPRLTKLEALLPAEPSRSSSADR